MFIIKRKTPKEKRVIDPTPYRLKPLEKLICTLDIETDPFEFEKIIKPFALGFYCHELNLYKDFWGAHCIRDFFEWLGANFEPLTLCIFVHNGGNFDFLFMSEFFDQNMKPFIIDGRLVTIEAGKQFFRDSYSMIPVPLGNYDKIKIDMEKFKDTKVYEIKSKKLKPVRELYKDEIRVYLKRDCTSLSELVIPWLQKFGNKLTMASAALASLKAVHGFETMPEFLDKEFRPYYFGGRCEALEKGVFEGNFVLYDINSSYPNVMANYLHPVSSTPFFENKITSKTHFAHIIADSKGALPKRKQDGSLYFPRGVNEFFACIHEIRAAKELGLLKIIEVKKTVYFEIESNFRDFVVPNYNARLEYSEAGDEINKLFVKLLLNSAYGKFAQDPRDYKTFIFDPVEMPKPFKCEICIDSTCPNCVRGESSPNGWFPHTITEGRIVWAKPQELRGSIGFQNIATAASITSAARAELLRGIANAKRPIYCDTDSLICEGLNVSLDKKALGAWKLEGNFDQCAIAGKKLYALFKNGQGIKTASKGAKLTAGQILHIAKGGEIVYKNSAPKISLSGAHKFTTRTIKRT